MGAGFLFNILAANVYLIPLFSYVGQLALVNKGALDAINHLKASLFPGPGNWLPSLFLNNMRLLGFDAQVHDVQENAEAAKIRVAYRSDLDIEALSAETGLAINAFNTNASDSHEHRRWHAQSFVVNVALARRSFKIAGGHVHPPIQRILRAHNRRTGHLQKQIRSFLHQPIGSSLRSILHLLRIRVIRWRFETYGVPIGHATERILRRLQAMGKSKHASPACKSVFLKTLLNGWPTARRMRSLAGNPASAVCLFCKSGQDSIEHMPHCLIVREFFKKNGCSCRNIVEFLGIDKHSFPFLFFRKTQILHVLHHSYNTIRHNISLDPNRVILANRARMYTRLR